MTEADLRPLPAAVAALVADFRAGLQAALDEALASFYLYGSVAFPAPPSWRHDVDFHVLVPGPIDGPTREQLHALHAHLARRHELGAELDGYYVTLADAAGRESPVSQYDAAHRDFAWALHRAHVLAGRFVLVTGVDPRHMLVAPDWNELEVALTAEMEFIESHPSSRAFGVLNAARVLYSRRTRDVVVSKYQAAEWSHVELDPEWHDVVAAAVRAYTGEEQAGDTAALEHLGPAFVAMVRRALASG